MSKHEHSYSRSKPTATVETCTCGRFRFTENAGPSIGEQVMKGPNGTEWIMDAWFVEVYGKVVATFRTKEAAREFIDNGGWSGYHPYLTHGPAREDQVQG